MGVINQAIPIVYQVKPIIRNAKTIFKIANSLKESPGNSPSTNEKSITKNNAYTNFDNESKPVFFFFKMVLMYHFFDVYFVIKVSLYSSKLSFLMASLISSVNLIKKRILWIESSVPPSDSPTVIKCLIYAFV